MHCQTDMWLTEIQKSEGFKFPETKMNKNQIKQLGKKILLSGCRGVFAETESPTYK